MRNQRIFFFRPTSELVCLDGKTGKVRWRKTPSNAPKLFADLRLSENQSVRRMAYVLCGDRAVYLMGLSHTLAVSAETGDLLWKVPAGGRLGFTSLHLLLRKDGLYICSGRSGGRYDPLSGKKLGSAPGGLGCAILTGSVDSIFSRTGRTFFDNSKKVHPQSFSFIRPSCTEGVTVSGGHLYWWPSWCTCSYSLYGVVALGPAGDFNFQQTATDSKRMENAGGKTNVAAFEHVPRDWPTFRGDSARRSISRANIATEGKTLWTYRRKTRGETTAPVAAGGLVFFSGSDGIVYAVDAATGKPRWKSYTGGAVCFPPTIAAGRVFVGSGDGWAYAFEAATGRRLWRFRAAPVERKIPVYGRLLSTWPAASGVLVDSGKAYVAAGITHYDGTHVYALDAATGKIRWQNNKTGNLWHGHGVSVLGHLLLDDDKLYLASGKQYSPAIFDTRNGAFLNRSVRSGATARGWELSLAEGEVRAGGLPLYVPSDFPVGRGGLGQQTFVFPAGDYKLLWRAGKISCFPHSFDLKSWLAKRRRNGATDKSLRWTIDSPNAVAVAVTANAVIVAEGKPPKQFGIRRPRKPPRTQLVALRLNDGQPLWQAPLPAAPIRWGLAIDRDGRTLVTCADGQLVALGSPK